MEGGAMKRQLLLVAILIAGAVGVVPGGALANAPNDESATYLVVTPIPNMAMAPNGDTAAVAVVGDCVFSVHPKAVDCEGTFTHTSAEGSFSTTWTALELLDFQPYGCGLAPTGATLPPNFCGGRVTMRIAIETPDGPVEGILTIFCVISDDGHFPAGVEEGVRLVIPGVINFNESHGGLNHYEKQ
jgi:hypothetical protein